MSNVIGMYDRDAERIARREIPDVEEALEIIDGVERGVIMEIAARCFKDPDSISPEEYLLVLAERRIFFENHAR